METRLLAPRACRIVRLISLRKHRESLRIFLYHPAWLFDTLSKNGDLYTNQEGSHNATAQTGVEI